MCVLMLFNSSDHHTYREIEQATGIPSSNLKRCLQSLACVKGKNVFWKEPMSKADIAESAVVCEFSSWLKSHMIHQDEVQPESESDDEDQLIYNPLKLPMGWDGKPIPYWL